MLSHPRLLVSIAVGLLLLGGSALADAVPVSFTTADGVGIHGTLHTPAGGEGATAVIALHMFLGDRTQFSSVAEEFTGRGIALLAIDLRGHGKSRLRGKEDLRRKALDRDPELYASMYEDVSAAVRFLTKRGYDGNRIGLLGASLGASVALDHAGRTPSILCVALLTPVLKQSGIDTLRAAKRFGGRPALILCAKDEVRKGAKALVEEALTGSQVSLRSYKVRSAHGTALLEKAPGIGRLLAAWFAARMAVEVKLDGVIDGGESSKAELRVFDKKDPKMGALLIRRFPDHLYLAARTSGPPQTIEVRVGLRTYRLDAEGVHRLGGGRPMTLPLPDGSVRSLGKEAVELLLPVGGFGLERGHEIRLSVRVRVGGAWSPPLTDIRLYFGEVVRRSDDRAPAGLGDE